MYQFYSRIPSVPHWRQLNCIKPFIQIILWWDGIVSMYYHRVQRTIMMIWTYWKSNDSQPLRICYCHNNYFSNTVPLPLTIALPVLHLLCLHCCMFTHHHHPPVTLRRTMPKWHQLQHPPPWLQIQHLPTCWLKIKRKRRVAMVEKIMMTTTYHCHCI